MNQSLTLAELIQNALDSKRHYEAEWGQHCPNSKLLDIYQESQQLAENALEERLQSMIDERIARSLKEIKP